MDHEERMNFAQEVIFKILRKAEKRDPKSFELLVELKDFIEAVGGKESVATVKLADVEFERDEAEKIYKCIVYHAVHYCSHAYNFGWGYDIWYVMAEILKACKVPPYSKAKRYEVIPGPKFVDDAELTDFINMFLYMDINLKLGEDDDKLEETVLDFMKKLDLVSSLGKPQL